ncbi:endonuclease NucS domain-containing protein [Capnocytophaga sp.]|uniref:endonuclease NucS domain-containing protein n=1 Tax=Capnocytophaga sp. TaxID=44737 RepID=UPI0026DCBE90|nr:endonuclease NucS domain-containing protein [Capnocytophaga sp.]MDO5104984.1 endonuclease NucS [Capnocytophaga sp.]
MQSTFQNWLEIKEKKSERTAYGYATSINRISKHYQENEGKSVNIYKITSTEVLRPIAELYNKQGKYADFGDLSKGTNRAAINAYLKFISNPENYAELVKKFQKESGFDSEQNLQSSLVYQIDTLFPEYNLVEEKYQIGGKEIDVLLEKGDELLVVELKKGEAKYATFGQISMYMGLLKEKFPNNVVKGCIIGNTIDRSLEYACRNNPDVSLKTYLLKIELVDF